MWRRIKKLYQGTPPTFHLLHPLQLPSQLRNRLISNIYYTPKVQKICFSQQLAKYLRYLGRKDKITNADLRTLTQNILVEYGTIHGLQAHPKIGDQINFGITKNYHFKPNQLCIYHGIVDYQVWLTDTHFFPVMFCEDKINPVAGFAMAYANMAQKVIAKKDYKNSGYSIVTTGQEWQMFKVFRNFSSEKSIVLEGRNQFRNLYQDFQMVEAVMGLIDQCLDTERQNLKVLKLAYKTLDEQKFMIEGTKEQAKKMSPISRLLLKYYKKKEDFNSE